MTKDQIDAIIALGGTLIPATGATVTAVFGIIKFFDYQKTRLQERSLGLTKVLKFEEANAKVLVDMENLRNADKRLHETDEAQEQRIDKLDEDYRELIRRVFDFYKGAYSRKD